MRSFQEKRPSSLSGYYMLIPLLALPAWAGWLLFSNGFGAGSPYWIITAVLAVVLLVPGFYVIQPNTARVLTFLGRYAGTDARQGLRWTVPYLIARHRLSQRLRNFESSKSKVNDATGNPIEIAGVMVWRIVSPAQAAFGVDDINAYVTIQGEAAIRSLAGRYPYGSIRDKEAGQLTLLSHPDEIADKLMQDMQTRVGSIGVEIIDARISHLAFAQEIAAAMLQRQQADALVDAREVIVDGAVGMVEAALKQLADRNIVDLTTDQKAALVSNLLVVLSGDRTPQPVVQTGSAPERRSAS